MNKSYQKERDTRKRNEQFRQHRRERERAELAAQLAALRMVRDHPASTPAERLEAVKMLKELS